MKITSTKFEHNARIPKKYTCNGENISPPLTFSGIPENTKSLALIMEDPDVPKHLRADGMWNHWILWNISKDTHEILEGEELKATYGITTEGVLEYGGPCPPDREHRYFFKLYALDIELDLKEGSTKEELEEAMKGHIIEKTELIGLYEQEK
jgi:Raf kinase inhibitor-like YbhB/YbcL family protein